jgi:hypothetical protein
VRDSLPSIDFYADQSLHTYPGRLRHLIAKLGILVNFFAMGLMDQAMTKDIIKVFKSI